MPNHVAHFAVHADDSSSNTARMPRPLVACASGLLLTAAAMFLYTSQSVAQADAADQAPSTVVQDVGAFLKTYMTTLQGEDTEAIRKLHVADERFAWFTDGKLLYKSPQDVVTKLAEMNASGLRFKTAIPHHEVLPLTDTLATVRADFSTKGMQGDRELFGFVGVITMLVERSDAGTWQVLQGHSSTPGGPPATGNRPAYPNPAGAAGHGR